jgi:hypothetical protein
MDFEKITKLIDQWKGLLTGIGLLLAAIIGVHKALTDVDLQTWSWPEIAVAAVSIVLLGIVTVRSHTIHTSRLVDPDALKLDPQSPEQLVGRGEDLGKLLKALANPLVFLVSESGCGKSALLRAGVAEGPAFTSRFLPIYVDLSVLNWEDGPLRAVREGFAQALPNDDPARSKLHARSTPRQYAEAFDDYYRRTQRRPLLLLDQFDDYQAEPHHRERFLPSDTRVWRNADSIARENAFWRMLRQCLQNDSVSIIVACREDAAQGLESIRFHPGITQFDLPRLEPGLVRLVVDRLTERSADKQPVIVEPQGGWTALRDRLVDDLEARGQVLPQQLKVVLGGLRTLRRTTLAAYTRAGRLGGLEAAFVAGAIARAARSAALREEDMLRLLLPLIDSTRQPPDKGPPQSRVQLAEEAQVSEIAAGRALERLEADEVVRTRNEFEDAAVGWQLDHAYLAQPILHIERERNHWHLLLVERARAYAEATWRRKWSTLLPLGIQVQLFGARLRQRFRYGEERQYAWRSLLRAIPIFTSLAFLAIGAWLSVTDTSRQLVTLAQAYAAVAAAPKVVDTHAPEVLAGLREAMGKSWDPAHYSNFLEAYTAVVGTLKEAEPLAAEELAGLREEIGKTTLSDRRNDLAQAYRMLAGKLKEDDPLAAEELVRLRESVDKTATLFPLDAFVQAYAILVGKLKDGDPLAAEECVRLREAIGNTTSRYKLGALAQAYAAVADKLEEAGPDAAKELAKLREGIGKTEYLDQLTALTHAYTVVAGRLKDANTNAAEDLTEAREAIGEEIGRSTDPYRLHDLAEAYAAVTGTLRKADAGGAHALAALRAAISKTTDSGQISALAQAYVMVAGVVKEADPQAPKVLTKLRESIGKTIPLSLRAK